MNTDRLATIMYPTDRYPLLVIRSTRTKLTMVRLDHYNLAPTDFCNGFPVYDYTFTLEEAIARQTAIFEVAHKTKRGYMIGSHIPVRLGEARYFRNMAD
jgi:hypothetical protein